MDLDQRPVAWNQTTCQQVKSCWNWMALREWCRRVVITAWLINLNQPIWYLFLSPSLSHTHTPSLILTLVHLDPEIQISRLQERVFARLWITHPIPLILHRSLLACLHHKDPIVSQVKWPAEPLSLFLYRISPYRHRKNMSSASS